jgi:phosphoenolpyruvate carboxykinase (ATP)
MTLPPRRYADLLGQKLRQHQASAWLLNTGWTGGGFGQGRRISLPHTRALVDAIMNDGLAGADYQVHPIFGLASPTSCPGVPSQILDPRAAWADPLAYDDQARKLAARFVENFRKFAGVDPAILAAGPKAG